MSDEKKYTEREKVLAEREAFINGSTWRYNRDNRVVGSPRTNVEEDAARSRYPLPKVTRPRVHSIPLTNGQVAAVRVVDGTVEYSLSHDWSSPTWYPLIEYGFKGNFITGKFRNVALTLAGKALANPTEEVEAEP